MLQKQILEEYLEARNYPSYRKISDETGINLSRVFRVVNGQEMKLSEFQTFKKCLNQDISISDLEFKKMFYEIDLEFSEKRKEEVKEFLSRKILWNKRANQ